MTVQRQAKLWLLMLAGSLFLLWLLSPILLPFVLGMAIAYFLDPVMARLAGVGMSRSIAAGVIIVGFSILVTLVFILLTPTVIEQIVGLVARLPEYFSALFDLGRSLWERALSVLDPEEVNQLKAPLATAVQRGAELLGSFINGVFDRSLKIVNVITLLSVTPLVAYYLLRDWPKVVDTVDSWLPLQHAPVVRTQASAIDNVLAGYVRGVATVCLTLGAFYGLALTAVGLNFGLTIGLVAGAISFIPYVGTFVGLVASVGVAALQFWPDWVMITVVFGVFIAGQILNDYLLTPRLVGDRIGLHPLWVIFALFAGGALFGFVGILLAMPVAAAIGVLARFAIGRYKDSELYLGRRAERAPLVVATGGYEPLAPPRALPSERAEAAETAEIPAVVARRGPA